MVQRTFSKREKAGQRQSKGSPKNIMAKKIAPRTNQRLSSTEPFDVLEAELVELA